jgi:hypothetical protein
MRRVEIWEIGSVRKYEFIERVGLVYIRGVLEVVPISSGTAFKQKSPVSRSNHLSDLDVFGCRWFALPDPTSNLRFRDRRSAWHVNRLCIHAPFSVPIFAQAALLYKGFDCDLLSIPIKHKFYRAFDCYLLSIPIKHKIYRAFDCNLLSIPIKHKFYRLSTVIYYQYL